MSVEQILAQMGPGANVQQILGALGQDFTNTVNKFKTESKTAYQEAIEAIESFYGDAREGRAEDYDAQYNVLSEALANLGLDFASTDQGMDYAADQQYLTESADAALATDLSWFEKLQTVQQDLYNAMLIEMAAQQAMIAANPQIATGGGGSGGSRRSGGGGGGGGNSGEEEPWDLTEQQVGQTRTSIEFPDLIDAINSGTSGLTRSQVEKFLDYYDQAETPSGALALVAEDQTDEQKALNVLRDALDNEIGPGAQRSWRAGVNTGGGFNPFTKLGGIAGAIPEQVRLLQGNQEYDRNNRMYEENANDYTALRNFFRTGTPRYGPVNLYESVTDTGTLRRKTETDVGPYESAQSEPQERSTFGQSVVDALRARQSGNMPPVDRIQEQIGSAPQGGLWNAAKNALASKVTPITSDTSFQTNEDDRFARVRELAQAAAQRLAEKKRQEELARQQRAYQAQAAPRNNSRFNNSIPKATGNAPKPQPVLQKQEADRQAGSYAARAKAEYEAKQRAAAAAARNKSSLQRNRLR